MDRIQNAIKRARNLRDARSTEAPETTAQYQRPLASAPGASRDSGFRRVSCNFNQFGRHRIISNEQDPILNAYRVLRTRVLQKMDANGWRTLAILSPAAGAGKTVTAINLAIAMGAKEGTNPTLVDLDFYRPSVAKYLGFRQAPSSLDYFEGKRDLRDVTVRPDLPNLLVIPNERVTRRGAEYLTSRRADLMIETTLNDYDSGIVIFDMSPLLGCDDSIAFLPRVDCALLVASSGETRVNELREARRILKKTNLAGTVLNKAPAALAPNHYY